MSQALFISPDFIKENSAINGNVDDKYIKNTIYLCQKLYLIPILGTTLYNEINDEIVAGSLSSDNSTLLTDYIDDCLLYYVLSEGISLFTYKIENKSVVKKNSDNSQPIDSEEVQILRDDYKNKAELFAQRATNYLCENASTTKYASYYTPGNGIDIVYPKKNNYESTWALDTPTKDYGFDVDYGRKNYC